MSDVFSTSDFYGTSGGDEAVDEVTTEVVEVDTTEVGPDEVGQADAEVQQPETNYFDPSQFADHKVKLTVSGETIEVPVTELVQGYQRQADYTQKTQALAAERQSIAFWQNVDAAMRINPQQTLEYLSKQFGADVAQQAQANADAATDDWGSDPADLKLQALQAELAPVMEFVQQQQAERELNTVLSGLEQKYGNDFDAKEVVSEALNRGVHDPSMLEAVFQSMKFNRYRAQAAAQGQVQTEAQQEAARRQAAAQQAAAATGGGASTPRGRAAQVPQAQPKTVWEAFEMAKAELAAQGVI